MFCARSLSVMSVPLPIGCLGLLLGIALTASPVSSAEQVKASESLWSGLRAEMPASEAAAYLRSKGVRVEETARGGIAVVIVKDRERFAGMKGEVSLGFSRRGLQTLNYDFGGTDLPDYATLIARLTPDFGKPIGEFAPRLYRGPNGNLAVAQVFFGGPPRSVSVVYTIFCPPYARRLPNERSISIKVDLRPIAFPPHRERVTGDADGWCDAH